MNNLMDEIEKNRGTINKGLFTVILDYEIPIDSPITFAGGVIGRVTNVKERDDGKFDVWFYSENKEINGAMDYTNAKSVGH